MKKRIRSALALAASLVLAASALSACGGNSHEHQYVYKTTTPASCLVDGVETGVCSICGDETSRAIPAVGHHTFGAETVVTPAGCESEGLSKAVCSVCHEEQQIKVDPLGHNFVYEVVNPATFESEGLQRGTCSRCEATDEQVIPKLDANTPIEYTFTVTRTSGSKLTAPGMKITISKQDGTVMATGTPTAGTFRAKLLPNTYNVTVSDVPEGYTAKSVYTVSAGDPNCAIVLTSSPIQKTPPANTRYRVNSLMYDFTLTALDGSKITLSDALKTKKGVILNFWATWCRPCKLELPDMQKLWQEYGDDVLLVGIDIDRTQGDTEQVVRSYLANDSLGQTLTFPIVYDPTITIFDMFGFNSYPSTVLIDREGVVTKTAIGTQTEAQWRSFFESLAGRKA